jgi:hypothetical protein
MRGVHEASAVRIPDDDKTVSQALSFLGVVEDHF